MLSFTPEESSISGLWKLARSLFHRRVFEVLDAGGCAVVELGGVCSSDVVLVDGAELSGDESSEPFDVAWRVFVAADDAGLEDREALEADRCDGFFFLPHDAHVPDPALRGAADC